jgi:hypothetical protein
MARGPEANFWNTLRTSLPKDGFAMRLENKVGLGTPDVYCMLGGLPFWLELKVNQTIATRVSKYQVAWHTLHYARGGLSFFLVKDPRSHQIYLVSGSSALELAQSGLGCRALAVVGTSRDAWDALRTEVVGHYAGRVGSGSEDRGPRSVARGAMDGAANDLGAPVAGGGAP